MLGAIAGDIIGSVYEFVNIKTTEFTLFHEHCRFTDDTVLTVALADSLLHGTPCVDLPKQYDRRYPQASYGASSHQWAKSNWSLVLTPGTQGDERAASTPDALRWGRPRDYFKTGGSGSP